MTVHPTVRSGVCSASAPDRWPLCKRRLYRVPNPALEHAVLCTPGDYVEPPSGFVDVGLVAVGPLAHKGVAVVNGLSHGRAFDHIHERHVVTPAEDVTCVNQRSPPLREVRDCGQNPITECLFP